MKFSADKTLITAIVALVLTIAAILFISVRQSQGVKDTAIKVSHTEEVLQNVQELILFVIDNETGARGFVLTGANEFLDQVNKSEQNISGELALLKTLIAEDPQQKAQVDSLSVYIDKRIALSNRMLSLRQQKGLEAAASLVSGEGKFYTDQVRRIGRELQQAEKTTLEKNKMINERAIRQLNIILYSFLGIVFLLSIVVIRKVRSDIAKQRLSEKKFSALLDAAPDATVIVNEKGIIQMINLQTENLFNYTRGELTGKPVEILVPQELREKHVYHREGFVKVARVRTMGAGLELNAVKKNGNTFPVEISLSPIQTEEGMLISASVRDITDRKHAEEQIKKQKQDIQDFIDSMSTLCAKVTTEGKLLLVNKTALQATGLSMEELLKTNFVEGKWWTFNPEVHSRVRDAFKKACSGTAINYDENIFVFGQVLTINFSLIPILRPDDSVDYIVAEGRDITPQKKAEEKIRKMNVELENRVEEKTREIIQSEKKFRNLIENSTDFISLTDENFKTLYRSPSAERVTGWTREERENLSAPELFHHDDLARMKIAMKEILKNPHKQFHLTFRHRLKDGHYIWLDGIMTNMLHDETIKAIVFNLRDITETKKAQELLEASENRFRSIIEQFPYPVVTYTPDGSYTNANEAWEKMWQYKREDVKDYNIRKDPQMIASGLSVYVEKAFAGEVATSEPYLYDPALIGYNSPKRWIQMTLYPLKNADGEILEVILILLDVTANKEAEESLRKSVKEISDYKYALDESSIVAITDQKGVIKYVNNNFCKISKYSREELIGQDHRIINSAYHPKEFIRDLWVTIANGKIWKGELKNKAKDGTIYWVDTTIIPFLNEEGKPYQYVAIRADITERKQAEQALQESQQLLLAIIDNSTAVIYVKDLQGRYLLVNRRFSELFHLSQEAVLGKTDYDFFSKENADAFRQMDVRTAAADNALSEEEKVPQDDGLHTYISVKSTLRDNMGKPYAIFGISTDITALKAVEENLRKSLREISDYKYALDESSIVAITDQKGIIKYANDNFCKISKYSREELIGQDHRIINSAYHPKEFIRDLWVTIANGNIWKGELKNKAKDGTIYWVDTTIIPFLNEEGKPYQYVAIRADITERKQVEENLQKSLKEIADYKYALDESSIVAITDQKGVIKYVNDNFCKISKYSREELIGQDHRIINSAYHPKEFIRNLWVTIANGKIWKGELKNKAKDGTIYWVDTTIIPFLNEEGKPYQYVAIRADITDRKKAENEIQELNEELEQKVVARTAELNSVNKEMEAFTYSVSHDLRAPLRGIVGFAAILEEEYSSKLDDEAKRITSVIKSNTLKMGRLIDDLLAFSKMGRQDIAKTNINTNTMVKEIIEELTPANKIRDIEWVVQSLPMIKGDINTIRQVWLNLISNAIKYSGKKEKPRIEIGSFIHEGQVAFFVKDNGVGFDEKYKDKLFKVFQRLHSAEEFEGTGVGLALVEKIISKHGGKVWARGEVDKGAIFYFSLPAAVKNFIGET